LLVEGSRGSLTTPLSQLLAAARSSFDIQAGSAWRDLRGVLPSLRGTVLDVGCGAQSFRTLISPQATYLGIDTYAAKALSKEAFL
jgi:hypothetical protein